MKKIWSLKKCLWYLENNKFNNQPTFFLRNFGWSCFISQVTWHSDKKKIYPFTIRNVPYLFVKNSFQELTTADKTDSTSADNWAKPLCFPLNTLISTTLSEQFVKKKWRDEVGLSSIIRSDLKINRAPSQLFTNQLVYRRTSYK